METIEFEKKKFKIKYNGKEKIVPAYDLTDLEQELIKDPDINTKIVDCLSWEDLDKYNAKGIDGIWNGYTGKLLTWEE